MSNLFEINNTETDFKAEVIASALVESGMQNNRIVIARHNGDKKNVAKDIDKIQQWHSGLDLIEYLFIDTNREGIYDSLPEGLFHETSASRNTTSKEDIIREIREQKGKEKITRKFFQPFEMVLDSTLIDAQSYERRYDYAHLYDNLTNIISEYWNILRYLSTEQALLFIKIIPIISEASHNFDLTSNIISTLLYCPVDIYEDRQKKIEVENQIKLGDWKLGVNSALGSMATYSTSDLTIKIGPISLDMMKLFNTDHQYDIILKELIGLLIPFNRNTNIKYRVNRSETKFRLSDTNHTAHLGINTIL